MKKLRRKFSSIFHQDRRKEAAPEAPSVRSLRYGSLLLEEIVTSFNGKHKIPVRSFTVEEIIAATNDFANPDNRKEYGLFTGSFEGRPILVMNFQYGYDPVDTIHDIVITSQMSPHKNVLRLLGYCLEFETPIMVYEHAGTQFLSDLLWTSSGSNDRLSFSWTSRLRIANEIANVIVYFHTAFPTPILLRDLGPNHVIVNQNGFVKLYDFSSSIILPPGEEYVQDLLVYAMHGIIDPVYHFSGYITRKTDVYSFGVLLLMLLTGQKFIVAARDIAAPGGVKTIVDYVKEYVENDEFDEIVDPRILREAMGTEQQQRQQLQACLDLALACTQAKGASRPEMIQVARELRRIERCIIPCPRST